MKWLFFIAAFACLHAAAQNTGRLENQKDAWGNSYTYIGELKNGKAHGMGIANYGSSGKVIRYTGNFVNGIYSGKGTMLFRDGAFLTGMWANGKLDGQGANLTSEGNLYIGDFKNGVRNGKGILVYRDKGVMKGSFANDKMNGRCINIWADGKIISENEFVDSKRIGTGFQYEATSKKLFEGIWKDDKWSQAGTATFTSFLQNSNFTIDVTDDHILMGPTGTDRFLKDTSYFNDLKKKKRYFGHYEKGFLRNGIIIGDSTRFMGQYDDKGAIGYCYEFEYSNYYTAGNYVNDKQEGDVVDIDLVKKSVYYGNAKVGALTGKAYFFNNSNEMFAGDYVDGRFTGQGYCLESNGRCITGSWKNGQAQKVTSILLANGTVIPGTPKTFAEALNVVIRSYPAYFDDVIDLYGMDEDNFLSLMTFPGSVGKNLIVDDVEQNMYYEAKFIETTDGNKAKTLYNDLAKQLQAATVNNPGLKKALKLKGTVTPVNLSREKTEAKFDLQTDESSYQDFHIWLQLVKNSEGKYLVLLKLGEMEEE